MAENEKFVAGVGIELAKPSLCDKCKHQDKDYPNLCLAFPEGIPLRFLYGKAEHKDSVEGDDGIVFEPK